VRALRSDGYSILELAVVLGIMFVVVTIAGFQLARAKPTFQADGAMRVVLAQVRAAREQAISERRYVRVSFINGSQMQTVREEVPGPATTTISTVALESGASFALVSGLPDTPDGFGNTQAVDFGPASTIKFTPDGTLVDANGNGVNGSVFIALPRDRRSARAITVLGSTGRIRAYRWDGRAWNLV
jgi:type II secretory pathway pseudopilin PulG